MPSLVSLVDMFGEPIPDLPGVPPDMMALLRAGMANDEADRPSAAALRDALLAVTVTPGGGPVSAPPAPPSVPTLPPGYPPAVASGDEPTQPHGAPIASPPIGRRGPWVAGGAATLALVTVIGLLTWYGLTHRHHPDQPEAHGSASASPSRSVTPSASASAGSISGRLTVQRGGQAAAHGWVGITAFEPTLGRAFGAEADADGRYTLGGLGPYQWPLYRRPAVAPTRKRQWPNFAPVDRPPIGPARQRTVRSPAWNASRVGGSTSTCQPSTSLLKLYSRNRLHALRTAGFDDTVW